MTDDVSIFYPYLTLNTFFHDRELKEGGSGSQNFWQFCRWLGRISALGLNQLGKKSLTTIILGNFVSKPYPTFFWFTVFGN